MSVAKDRQFFTGDPCPECNNGHLYVYCTVVIEPYRQQYLACNTCHEKPTNNKIILPLSQAPRRHSPRKIKVRRRRR
jgi:hypothetical protein